MEGLQLHDLLGATAQCHLISLQLSTACISFSSNIRQDRPLPPMCTCKTIVCRFREHAGLAE